MSNLERKTVVQLKELLKEHGLSTSGVKSDLVFRLESYYEKNKKKKEESSSEDEKPKRKGKKKQSKKKESTSEEESSEEPSEEVKPKKGKKRKLEEDEDTEKQPAKKSKIYIKVDKLCKVPGAEVYEDWAVTLNQTNVGQNNNKFYVIQLVCSRGTYYNCHTRWGRVGETGKSQTKSFDDLAGAKADFEKKFRDKTKNEWSKVRGNHAAFVKKPKQYDWIEMDHHVDAMEEVQGASKHVRGSTSGKAPKVRPCTLEKPTKDLLDLIFNHDMFKQQMVLFDLNVNELPLGKISQSQINKGYGVLDSIEQAIKTKSGNLEALSGKFYTQIPHSFGRKTPPIMSSLETVQQKRDMLAVLGDIELAAELQQNKKNAGPPPDEVDHPSDVNYKLLDTDLEPLNKKSDEFKTLNNYLNATMGDNNFKIEEIFKVNRHHESDRFSLHDSITNRKLLWHGTNVAVVVAILKSGLRIMPHSGGRVGRGIYFASENSKSANYVTPAGSTGIMFLNEVALGKEYHITDDDSSLTKAPSGYDCIIAKGWTEPDPSKDVKRSYDNHDVIIPQGKPIKIDEYKDSSFSQTEYLVYKESQNRIRYLLKLSMN